MRKISAQINTCVAGALALLDAGYLDEAESMFRLALETATNAAAYSDIKYVRKALSRYLYLFRERNSGKATSLRMLVTGCPDRKAG